MARLTVRLPETLHQNLVQLANREGVSLNQYITYALTRQVTRDRYTVTSVSDELLKRQRDDYASLLEELGEASFQEVQEVLKEREPVNPEEGLTHDVVQQLREKLDISK